MIEPPGNSLAAEQGAEVAPRGDDVVSGLLELLARIRDEIDFNDAKGDAPYRLGMHDALRFAEDAIVDLLRRHGYDAAAADRPLDA